MITCLEARAVRQDNVLLIGPYPDGEPLEAHDTPGRLDRRFKHCNIALVIAQPGTRTPYAQIMRLLHASGVPCSLVLHGVPDVPGGASLAAFFPLEDPTPCWRCLELRWLGWAPDTDRALSWLESLQHPDICPPARRDASPEETLVLLSWTAMDMLGADPGLARLVLDDGSFTEHHFMPHPQCAWCSPWSGVKPRPPLPPVDYAQLIDRRFGLLRVDTDAALPPRLEPQLAAEPELSLSTATHEPSHPLPAVVRITQPSPYLGGPHPDPVLQRPERELSADAVLDGLARYASHLRAGRPFSRGTRRGVALPAPAPSAWMSPLVKPSEGERGFDEGLELDWARAHDLHSGDVIAVPADLVYEGAPRDGLPRDCAALPCAHPSLNVSVRWALSRVAEDDALMVTWHVGCAPRRVSARHLPEAWRDALDDARETGAQIEIIDIGNDLGIPVLAVIGRHLGRWFHGCGASWQAERALRAAWARAMASRARALPDPGAPADFLFEGPESAMPETVPSGVTDPIDTWRHTLGLRGMQGLWIDITPPDVAAAGIVVTRAWIAGTLPRPPVTARLGIDPTTFASTRAGARLMALAQHARGGDEALRADDLNLTPHPFA